MPDTAHWLVSLCVLPGLSASVFTSLYIGFLAPDAMAYLQFLAVTPSIIIVITQFFLNHVPFIQASEIQQDTGMHTSPPLHCFIRCPMLSVRLFSKDASGGRYSKAHCFLSSIAK